MKALQVSGSLAFLLAVATSAFGFDTNAGADALGVSRITPGGDVQRRDCRPAAAPKSLPAADAIVDVAAVRRAILADSASVPLGGATFSLRFGGNGLSEWVEAIAGTDANLRDSRLHRIVARHVRLQPVAKEPWSVRLKIISSDTIGHEVSRSELCPVERMVREGGGIERVSGIATIDEINDLRNSSEVRIVVDVSATGQAVRVALVQSSGSRIADENALLGVRDAVFRPALVDGIPVAGRYEHNSRTAIRRTR